MIPRLFHRYGRVGVFAFLGFTLALMALLWLVGDRPSWAGHWAEPYSVEVCSGLLVADPAALPRIAAAYAHVEAAGHPGPVSIDVGDCLGPVDGVRWAAGVPSSGRAGETTRELVGEEVVSALVVLSREHLTDGLYRHEAWHTIGARHPWFSSTGHVLHPGGPGHTWGTATRGYEVTE